MVWGPWGASGGALLAASVISLRRRLGRHLCASVVLVQLVQLLWAVLPSSAQLALLTVLSLQCPSYCAHLSSNATSNSPYL